MTHNYQKIGDYISVLDNRNADGSITNLMGISIDKCYIPSVANVIGTDLQKYKVIRKGQFACSLMQVSRDQRIPLAMYSFDEPAIMSPAYVMFEVNRPDELLPEYMELWFKRAEFDREASFYAVGGVRGSLDWEDFCKMKLPVPPIPEQNKIVHDYQVIVDRIELLQKMNENLEAQAMTVFESRFVSPEGVDYDENGIPVGWQTFSLADVVNTTTDSVNPQKMKKDSVWHYSIPAFDAERLPVSDEPNTILSNKYRVPLDSILVSKLNPDTKRIWLSDSEFKDAICSTEFIVYTPKKKEHRSFYYVMFNTKVFIDFLVSNATGSTNSRIRVKPSSTLDYTFSVPSEMSIDEYSKAADPFLKRMTENNKEIRQLKMLWSLSTTAMMMNC